MGVTKKKNMSILLQTLIPIYLGACMEKLVMVLIEVVTVKKLKIAENLHRSVYFLFD